MQKVNGHIIRPLLDVSRVEIQQYAEEHHLQWREDHTNAETLYLRNKIRHELLPVIDGISKEGRSAILKSINHLASENELYRELLIEKLPTSNCQLSTVNFQLLFEWLRDYGFNEDQVHFIHEALNSGQPGTNFFSPTHRVTIERNGLELTPICQQNATPLELSYEQITNDCSFVMDTSNRVAQLDYEKLSFPLQIRKWQAGDRFHPLGMKGSKLLSDFFVDQKFTEWQKRKVWLLVSADGDILWVVGHRIDDRFKIKKETKTIFECRMDK